MAALLIVDDEPSICWALKELARQTGHNAAIASSAEQALAELDQTNPDAIFLDVRLPGMDGLSAIAHFRDRLGNVPIVIMTAFGDLSVAVEAVRQGALDYLVKPFELGVAERAFARAAEQVEAARASRPAASVESADGGEERIVGSSRPMQEVFKRIAVVAPSTACAHLRGESGTGKELVARAIHRHSPRAAGPFIAVNVAALSPGLAESELFGHARGSFTGADQSHTGLLERAHGGTIFLDEVADIPLSLQVKLLRVLEYGEVLPVGGSRPVRSDFRVISATHQNLYQRVSEGAFRHDLYFRLVTFEIEIPPLRERLPDIALLAEHFLTMLAAKNNAVRPALSAEALRELEARQWWGNVRELRNAMEHALILARGGAVRAEHLPPPTPPSASEGSWDGMLRAMICKWAERYLTRVPGADELRETLLKIIEPPLFEVVLRQHQGQVASAARQLGLHRVTLKKKLDQYGLSTRLPQAQHENDAGSH